jgi:hypothetical protein
MPPEVRKVVNGIFQRAESFGLDLEQEPLRDPNETTSVPNTGPEPIDPGPLLRKSGMHGQPYERRRVVCGLADLLGAGLSIDPSPNDDPFQEVAAPVSTLVRINLDLRGPPTGPLTQVDVLPRSSARRWQSDMRAACRQTRGEHAYPQTSFRTS